MESHDNRPISRQIKDTHAFSGKSLFFGILASAVCSAIIPALGAGRLATVAGAALSPLLVAMITTQGRGPARSIGIALLSAFALVITIGGFTLPEAIAGQGSLTSAGSGTFWSTERTPEPTPPAVQKTNPPVLRPTTPKPTPPPATPAGMKVDIPEIRKCPEVEVGGSEACKQIGIRNVGSTTVEVTTGELDGDQSSEFTLTKVCNGTLKPNTACSIRLRFQPTATGAHEAFLVVYLQPGGVERRVTITGNAVETGNNNGSDGCREGFVPRKAVPGDSVCVTPEQQAIAEQQNGAHIKGQRANLDGTCIDGFVWREAVPEDHICVTPSERAATRYQNQLNPDRVAS